LAGRRVAKDLARGSEVSECLPAVAVSVPDEVTGHGDADHTREREQLEKYGKHCDYAPVRSMIAAVPYATTSVIVWPSSEESNRIMTTALAPITRAFSTIRSIAWRRVSSTSRVYSTISPPAMVRRLAMMLPARPRLRTTTPKTWPRAHFTSYPAGLSVVVTSTGERCCCATGCR